MILALALPATAFAQGMDNTANTVIEPATVTSMSVTSAAPTAAIPIIGTAQQAITPMASIPVIGTAQQVLNSSLITPEQASSMNLQTIGTAPINDAASFNDVMTNSYKLAEQKKATYFSVNVVSMGNSSTGFNAIVTLYNK